MALPELSGNPEHEIRQAMKEFFLSTKRGIDDDRFLAHWSQLTKDFKESIRMLKPTVNMLDIPDSRDSAKNIVGMNVENHNAESAITIDDTDDDQPDPTPSKFITPVLKRKNLSSGTPEELMPPLKKRESITRVSVTRLEEKPLLFTPATERFGTPGQERVVETPLGSFKHERLSLAGIRREMGDMAKPGVPDAVELRVHEVLALRSIQRWKGPFEAYITETISLLGTMFQQVLEVRDTMCFILCPSYLFTISLHHYGRRAFGLDVLSSDYVDRKCLGVTYADTEDDSTR